MPLEKAPTHIEAPAPKQDDLDVVKTAPWPTNVPETEIPTHQDSMDLYHNALAVEAYYKNNKKYQRDLDFPTRPATADDVSDQTNKTDINNYLHISNYNPDGHRTIDEYYKEVSAHKYYKRDKANNLVDFNSPNILYDRRILPHEIKYFKNVDPTDHELYGDQVNIPVYNPLWVKPYSELTEAEKVQRLRERGGAGFPKEYQNRQPEPPLPKNGFLIQYKDPKKALQRSGDLPYYKFDYLYFDTPEERDAYWNEYVEKHLGAMNHYDKNSMMWIPVKLDVSHNKRVVPVKKQ